MRKLNIIFEKKNIFKIIIKIDTNSGTKGNNVDD